MRQLITVNEMAVKYLFVMLSFLLMASAAFAGNLVVIGSNQTPSYANTGDLVNMLNLNVSANMSGTGTMNISRMNITINRIMASGNISGIFIYVNGTGNTLGTLVGSNTSITENVSVIQLNPQVNVSQVNHTTLFIYINISKGATPREKFNVTLNSTQDIEVSEGNNVHNLTTTNSSTTQIQHVHSIGTITPRYVDTGDNSITGVQNQSFVIYLEINGTDRFENISIRLPSQYVLINITGISNSTYTLYGNYSVGSSPYLNLTFGGDTINISNYTNGGGYRGLNNGDGFIKINFTANTSASAVSSLHFNVTMTGSNLTNVNVTDNATGSMNVTTQDLITLTAALAKRTAIVNGSDFWEINLTINITANVSGILQFRMNNWNSTTVGYSLLNITNESGLVTSNSINYAMLRNTSGTGDTNSGQFNISTEYGAPTRGLALRYTGLNRTLVLKMIIPLNTPTASDFRTTYFWLFRSET